MFIIHDGFRFKISQVFFFLILFSYLQVSKLFKKKTNQGELNNAPAVAHPRNSDSFSRATPVTHSYDVIEDVRGTRVGFSPCHYRMENGKAPPSADSRTNQLSSSLLKTTILH